AGAGGAGVFLVDGGQLDNQAGAWVHGGAGGGDAAFGADGGAAVLANRGRVDNVGTIEGGAGGAGNFGGHGGDGIVANGTRIDNTGTVRGGKGGDSLASATGYRAGDGG